MSNKYYKEERARQARFKKSEEEMNKKYKEMTDEESAFEYLNSLHPEDSTREYNPVEHYIDGGSVMVKTKLGKNKATKLY